jgi:H+/Cl- antiporter ClcA
VLDEWWRFTVLWLDLTRHTVAWEFDHHRPWWLVGSLVAVGLVLVCADVVVRRRKGAASGSESSLKESP